MNLPAPQKGLNYIVLKEMWTGQVNVGFPWLLTSTVTRHQPSRKQQSVLLLLLQLQTFLNSAFAQRAEKCAGKWKTRPVTHQCSWNSRTKFSSTFSFCRFSPRAGRLASGRTFFFFPTEFRSGLAVVWSGEGGPVFSQPCGASSAQLQSAGKQETERQRLSLLSSTTENKCLLEIFSRI